MWSVVDMCPSADIAWPYLEVASGSIPLFLIASKARAEARNSIRRLEPSISPEPATTAAENVCTNWISGAMLPAKSTPAACKISLTGITARSAPPAATILVASVPRGVNLGFNLVRDAEPRKKIVHKPDAAGASWLVALNAKTLVTYAQFGHS
jgi:hypothetical protein